MTDPHPHDGLAPVPVHLPAAELRALSALSPGRALSAIAAEWLGIAGAILVAERAGAWPVTLLALLFIGGRQHALTVIAHDASHFRLLPDRAWNDGIGNLLLAWPMFISVQGFRHFHGPHHRYLGEPGDGNRELWGTHDATGARVPEWRYPASTAALLGRLLRRAAGPTGLYWMLRGLVGGFLLGGGPTAQVVRVAVWGGVFTLLGVCHAWAGFLLYWVVPYCTWHVLIQYTRLVCEHSVVPSEDPRYRATRTTIPGWWGRTFVLPRNIGYHLEHHWFPSVPFYRLPELHARLWRDPGFRAHANVQRSVWGALRETTRPPPSEHPAQPGVPLQLVVAVAPVAELDVALHHQRGEGAPGEAEGGLVQGA